MRKIICFATFSMVIQPLLACTIFVLTDGKQALFFNNEDFTNPVNRMWFVPGGKDFYGCVFVGYDDGSAQGGLNTKGLAFDWYAGAPKNYRPAAHLAPINDNSSERMLEQCATVEEAIDFYRTFAEPGFAKASVIIADKSGNSVVIEAKDGQLVFHRSSESNVLGGPGKKVFERLYNEKTPITLSSGSQILRQCVATGRGGTLYSNSYNLKTGDIHIYDFSGQNKYVTLNLHEEIRKGGHYYNISGLQAELDLPLKPLLLNMQRLILFEFQPLKNQEPAVSSVVSEIFREAARGNLKAEYFADEFWEELKSIQGNLRSELNRLGKLKSHHLIRKETRDENLLYSFVVIFENARLLQQFRFDKNGKVADFETRSAFVINSDLTANESKNKRRSDTIRLKTYLLTIFGVIAIGLVIFIFARRYGRNAT